MSWNVNLELTNCQKFNFELRFQQSHPDPVQSLLPNQASTYITYILLDVLLCSIAEYFYELCRILTIP